MAAKWTTSLKALRFCLFTPHHSEGKSSQPGTRAGTPHPYVCFKAGIVSELIYDWASDRGVYRGRQDLSYVLNDSLHTTHYAH